MKVPRWGLNFHDGAFCLDYDVERLEASHAELLEALKIMAAQHYCGCGHASCKRCADDRMCYDVIAKAEGKD